jgi:hypothetical protein
MIAAVSITEDPRAESESLSTFADDFLGFPIVAQCDEFRVPKPII